MKKVSALLAIMLVTVVTALFGFGLFAEVEAVIEATTATPQIDASVLNTLNRNADPVILTGAQFPDLDGVPLAELVLYAFDGLIWEPVPFQIDEVNITGTFVFSEDLLFDANDELVFMPADAGLAVDDLNWPRDGAARAAVRHSIEVSDTLLGGSGWVYLYRSNSLPRSNVYYLQWDALSNSLTAVSYTLSFTPDKFLGIADLTVNGSGIDLLDRQKLQVDYTGCVLIFICQSDTVNEESALDLLGGGLTMTLPFSRPVRMVSGADTQLFAFYPGKVELALSLPLSDTTIQDPGTGANINLSFDRVRMSLDLNDPVAGAFAPAVYYDSALITATIDGVNDPVSTAPMRDWYQVNTAVGGLLLLQDVTTQGTASHYYLDDSSVNPTDTGDQKAFGETGAEIMNPDGLVELGMTVYALPLLQTAVGDAYLAQAATPLVTVVTAESSPFYYLDKTTSAGISVTHHTEFGNNELYTWYTSMGQAWADVDGDGWEELYVTDQYGPNLLYHNQGDGTFVPAPMHGDVRLPDDVSGGAVFADYNNDGWRDLYVLNYGMNRLFRNDGGTGFTDVTAVAGVGDPNKGETAVWGDYDQDGFLDLYITNWTCWPECGFDPNLVDFALQQDRLYHNNGDGTFTDVTTGTLAISQTRGAGFTASFVDYDNDGDLDLYVVNDEFSNPVGNVLWRNDGAGCGHHCFTDVSVSSGAGVVAYGMGLAVGDYDHNGYLDFYFSNMMDPSVLLQNQGDGSFVQAQAAAGVDFSAIFGWGTVFIDYNNDGWQDLYLNNAGETPAKYKMFNPLFENNGDGTFTNLAALSGADDPYGSMGLSYADYNQDGWVDLVVGNMDWSYRLYENQGADHFSNSWVGYRLHGGGPVNRDGIGARVYLTTTNGLTQFQELKSGSSLGAGNSMMLHFGLGMDTVAAAHIVWPDGTAVQLSPAQMVVGQYHQLYYARRIYLPLVNK